MPRGLSGFTATAVATLFASLIAGCSPAPRLVHSGDSESPRPYMQFSVIVDREPGSLGPAQIEADGLCAEVLQSALMYMAAEVGEDQTRYYFRCR